MDNNEEEIAHDGVHMATLRQRFQQFWIGWPKRQAKVIPTPQETRSEQMVVPPLDIAPNDPIVAYFLSSPGPVEVDKLHLDSPALHAMKVGGVKLTIPLVSHGELVGLLNLGSRLSEQDYSADDRGLLNTLATQGAPAVRVAQLVREHQSQARERERIEQELRVARLIQHTLLPKDLPALPGWQLTAYYQAAREVGGDFYDFLYFEDGRYPQCVASCRPEADYARCGIGKGERFTLPRYSTQYVRHLPVCRSGSVQREASIR